VLKALAPGGMLYYEVDRRSMSFFAWTPARFQKWLQAAGLTPTGVYWVAPDFENCKRYIPLDGSQAFQWYLSTLFVAGTFLYRFLEICLRLWIGSKSWRFASFAPCYAVTAEASPERCSPASILSNPLLPADFRKPDVRTMLVTSGQDDGSRAVLFPFSQNSKKPFAAFKTSTLPAFNCNVEREHAAMAKVRDCMEEPMRRTIPQPLGLFHYGKLAVGMESCANGYPLFVSSGRWRATFDQQVKDLRMAVNWLIKFHNQANNGWFLWDASARERWINHPLQSYEKAFDLTEKERQLFTKTRLQAERLDGATLPLVWLHYDFGPWNLYCQSHHFTVIDWEFGGNWERGCYGPPFYDLLFFVVHWFHIVKRLKNLEAELAGFYHLFVHPDFRDRYVRVTHDAIANYVDELSLERRFLPIMIVYLWIEQTLSRRSRKEVLRGEQVNSRKNNPHTRYIELLAEHADSFFMQYSGG
jgi:hypothetical protein